MSDRPPTDGMTFWRAVFGRDASVEIEIGSGDGSFLITYARRHPDRLLLGMERSPSKARRLEVRLARLEVPNLRVLQADARCVVASILPDASVAAYHVYFPDPWPKRAHADRRIFTTSFVAALARTLILGGRLYFATDVASYARVASGLVLAGPEFRVVTSDERHPGLGTSFARKYRAGGRALTVFTFERVADQVVAAPKMRSR